MAAAGCASARATLRLVSRSYPGALLIAPWPWPCCPHGFREAAEVVGEYVKWYNSERPCWSLGYMTPDAYYEAPMAGEIGRRDIFEGQVLDPTPKFVREKFAAAEEAAESNGGDCPKKPSESGVERDWCAYFLLGFGHSFDELAFRQTPIDPGDK